MTSPTLQGVESNPRKQFYKYKKTQTIYVFIQEDTFLSETLHVCDFSVFLEVNYFIRKT